ncbi:hypothetical protein CPB85DRAFT_1232398, partial [Mucidula mucida]
MKRHTVYEGELSGSAQGLVLVERNPKPKPRRAPTTADFLIDNQSSITGIHDRRPQLGRHIVELFHKLLPWVKKKHPNLKITLIWVPGHIDVPGNEKADEHAKRAA